MPAPTYLEGDAFDVNYIFNAGRDGFSENYTLIMNGVADPYAAAYTWTEKYARERRKILHQNLTLEATRVSQQGITHDSKREVAPNKGMGAGLVDSNPAPYKDGFYMVFRDASMNVKAQHGYGGLGVVDMDLGTAQGADRLRPTNTTRVGTWGQKLREMLVGNQITGGGAGTMTPAIETYNRDVYEASKLEVKTWDTDDAGWLKLTLRSGNPAWGQGTELHLTHKKSHCVRGLQGVHKVISKEETEAGVVLRLDTKLRCNKATLTGLLGWLQLREKAFVGIADVAFGIYGERVVGGAFFRQAGRQKGKN